MGSNSGSKIKGGNFDLNRFRDESAIAIPPEVIKIAESVIKIDESVDRGELMDRIRNTPFTYDDLICWKGKGKEREETEEAKTARAAKAVDEAVAAQRIANGSSNTSPELDVNDLPVVFKLDVLQCNDMRRIMAEISARVDKARARIKDGKYTPLSISRGSEISSSPLFGADRFVMPRGYEHCHPKPDLKPGGGPWTPCSKPTSAYDAGLVERPSKPLGCQVCGTYDHKTAFCSYLFRFPADGPPIHNTELFMIVCGCGNRNIDQDLPNCNQCISGNLGLKVDVRHRAPSSYAYFRTRIPPIPTTGAIFRA